jgi:hypothetical protein
MSQSVPKRAKFSRLSGQWQDENYDVVADARGGDGGGRQELAAGVVQQSPLRCTESCDCTPTSIDHAAVCILFSCLRYFSISSRVATP